MEVMVKTLLLANWRFGFRKVSMIGFQILSDGFTKVELGACSVGGLGWMPGVTGDWHDAWSLWSARTA